jgi:hypothetical protein
MNEFNMLVLNIAIIVFIIALVVVGLILYYSVRNSGFPPFDTQCPTYFKLDASGNNCLFDTVNYPDYSRANNYPALARPPTTGNQCNPVPVSTFYANGFTRDEVLCAKNRWSQRCGVFWDGVTNNPQACMRENSTLSF